MFHLKNLSAQAILTGTSPWDFKSTTGIEDIVRTDKKARTIWINWPSTEHHVYSFNEGVNPNLRISKPRSDGGGNPIHKTHALVADYDAPTPEGTVLGFAKKLPYPPNFIEKTLSGNWRYIWLLEEALIFPSFNFARHFYESFADFAFDPARGSIGFDKPAWEAPERLWTNSCDWRHVTDDRIPADVSRGWLVKASESFKFNGADFGPVIPLEDITPELVKRYPKFSTWPGEFTLGAHGPTFWVDASLSPKSATVRETGLQTFSANAPKAFYSWADLLGIAFVKDYEANAAGRSVEGIHYDGRVYYRKLESGKWRAEEKTDLMLYLRGDRNVSSKRDKNGLSEVEKAVCYIRANQCVEIVAPFIYQPEGVIEREGKRILNTSSLRVLEPAEGVAVWGASGSFPWLSNFFDHLLGTPEQKNVLLAWASWAFCGAYRQQPESGHIVFLAGPTNVGKTLLNRAIFGVLFGGIAEAGPFLLGEEAFNADLFQAGYWAVDDNEASADHTRARKWTSGLKRVAANSTWRCHEKFKTPHMTEWQGRLFVTLNADSESSQLLPDLSQSILDKLILLRTAAQAPCVFPPRYELKKILAQELPFFARWLLDHEIPAALRGNARFGVKEFADSSLVDTARQSCQVASFSEILEDWHKDHFTIREPNAPYWQGTAFQLLKQILLDPSAASALRSLNAAQVGRNLSSLLNKGDKRLEIIPGGGSRIWRIYRTEKPEVTLDEIEKTGIAR